MTKLTYHPPARMRGLYEYTPTPRKAVWLLDVDGVINVTEPGEWPGHAMTSFAWNERSQRRYRMIWVPQVVNFIRERAGLLGDIEVRWATTWCGSTRALEGLWDLDEFDDALDIRDTPPGRRMDRGAWIREVKRAAARQVVENGDRLIWTDDQVVPLPGDELNELVVGNRALAIRPDDRYGLQERDLDAIAAFAKGGS